MQENMSKQYRPLANGYISVDMSDYDYNYFVKFIRGILDNHNADGINVLTNPLTINEVLVLGKQLIGNDFRAFLIANYHQGMGYKRTLIKNMVNVLVGELPTSLLVESIKMEETSCRVRKEMELETVVNRVFTPDNKFNEKVNKLNNYDFYVLFTLLGMELFIRFILTFNNEVYSW